MLRNSSRAGLVLLTIGLLGGCGSSSGVPGSSDSGTKDSGVKSDSSMNPVDSGGQDSTLADSGTGDTAVGMDTSTGDTAPPEDTGATDSAIADSGGDTSPPSDAATYTIGGSITGLNGSVVLQDNGGDSLTLTANGMFVFTGPLASGAAYSVSVFLQPLGGTCSVTNATGSVAGANVTNVTVTCATLDGGGTEAGGGDSSNLFTVGGTVSGLGAGDSVTLQDNSADNITVSANGSFTFLTPLASGAPYAATVLTQPTNPSQTCTISNASGTVANANVAGVVVTCVTSSFTVGGTLTGLAATGTVVLQDNLGDSLPLMANGGFTFATPVASGAPYSVTVLTQPSGLGQTCTVTAGTGTVGAAKVTSVVVSCGANTYTIGGTVTGLPAGQSLVLQDNGGDNLPVSANGAFTFATGVASGNPYAVTVHTQPVSVSCVVSAGSGTVAGSNVSSVVVNCSNISYAIGGSVSGLAPGDSVELQDNATDSLFVSMNGSFAFPTTLQNGATFNVTVQANPVQPVAQTCTVTNPGGTVMGANVTMVTVTCTTNTYTIGGTVSGLAAGGSFSLVNNGGNALTVNGTSFTFTTPVGSGSTYNVTAPTVALLSVQTAAASPIPQTCTVTANGSGTVGNANVTNVTVACVTNNSCGALVTGVGAPYPSGAYAIDPSGAAGAGFQAYCDMADQGGGWTLIAKMNGANKTTLQTWSYDQPIWTDATTLNPSSTDLSQTEAKFATYGDVPFTSVLMMMTGATGTNVQAAPTLADATSFQHLIASSAANTVTTSLGRQAWLNLTNPTSSPQANCNLEGVNMTKGAGFARVRLGLLTNQENDCNSPDSYVGFGGENTDGCYGQPYFGPAAGSAGGGGCGGPDVTDFGYIFVR